MFSSVIEDTVATKQDVRDSAAELKTEIAEIRAELKTEISNVKSELKLEIAELRGKFDLLYWMNGFMLVLMSSVFFKLFLH